MKEGSESEVRALPTRISPSVTWPVHSTTNYRISINLSRRLVSMLYDACVE